LGYDYATYFHHVLECVNSAVTVRFREVEPREGETKLNDCHRNVDRWIQNHPEIKAVRGWLFWPANEAARYTLMAHSVVGENDQLFDITSLDPNTPREGLVFLRHLAREEDFSAMKTPCATVLCPPFNYDEWHESQLPVQADATNP
jgi:hypothetical protein